MMQNDCSLIIPFYGNDANRAASTKLVLTKIVAQQAFVPTIYLVYLSQGNYDVFSDVDFPEVKKMRIKGTEANEGIFLKESLFNYAFVNTSEKYMAFLDCDLYSEDPLWLLKAYDLVSQYDRTGSPAIIQMFRSFKDSIEDKENLSYVFAKNTNYKWGSPGGGWAMSRQLLVKAGGFNQFCIAGSGDCCFVMEFAGIRDPRFEKHFGMKWFNKVFRSSLNINAQLDYADSDLIHVSHGSYVERAYVTSRLAIDYFGTIDDLVTVDKNGLTAWKDPQNPLKGILLDKKSIADNTLLEKVLTEKMPVPDLPNVDTREMMNDTAMILVHFDSGDTSLLRSCTLAMEKLLKLNPTPHMVLVDICPDPEKSKWDWISSYPFVTHLKVKIEKRHTNIFHKEDGFNIGARSLDLRRFKYLIFHDLDSFPLNSQWALIIKQTMMDWIARNGKDNFMLQNFSCYFDSVGQVRVPGYVFDKEKKISTKPIGISPGLSWTMTSDFFQRNNGWYCKAINGANDAVSVFRWDSTCYYSTGGTDCLWYKNILEEVKDDEKATFYYVPIEMCHIYHGSKRSRAFEECRKIISKFCDKIDELVYVDKSGLTSWKNENHILSEFLHSKKSEMAASGATQFLQDQLCSKGFTWFGDYKVVPLCITMWNVLRNADLPMFYTPLCDLYFYYDCVLIEELADQFKTSFDEYSAIVESRRDKTIRISNNKSKMEFFVYSFDDIEKFKTRLKAFGTKPTFPSKSIFISDLDAVAPAQKSANIARLKALLDGYCENILICLDFDETSTQLFTIEACDTPNCFVFKMKCKISEKAEYNALAYFRMLCDLLTKKEDLPISLKIKTLSILGATDQISHGSLNCIGDGLIKTQLIPGEIVEIGCHKGDTSLFMRKILDELKSEKELYLYDSFQGLSKPNPTEDGDFPQEGAMTCSIQDVLDNFVGYKQPVIYEGFVEDTLPKSIPEVISFAFVDCDLYEPILLSLNLIDQKLQKGGVIAIHDYQSKMYLGSKKAADKFLETNGKRYKVKDRGTLILEKVA